MVLSNITATGIYARHVRNLQMEKVQLLSDSPDERPETVSEDGG